VSLDSLGSVIVQSAFGEDIAGQFDVPIMLRVLVSVRRTGGSHR